MTPAGRYEIELPDGQLVHAVVTPDILERMGRVAEAFNRGEPPRPDDLEVLMLWGMDDDFHEPER